MRGAGVEGKEKQSTQQLSFICRNPVRNAVPTSPNDSAEVVCPKVTQTSNTSNKFPPEQTPVLEVY